MAIDAVETQGTVIAIGDGGGPETFTAIPGVLDFDGPGGSPTIIDHTAMDDTSKRKKVGLKDEGTLSLTLKYNPDNAIHAGIRTDRANRTLRNFEMTFQDTGATKWSFAGYVTEFSVSGGVDDFLRASVGIEIDGDITES